MNSVNKSIVEILKTVQKDQTLCLQGFDNTSFALWKGNLDFALEQLLDA